MVKNNKSYLKLYRNLNGNNFTGRIPDALLERRNNGLLLRSAFYEINKYFILIHPWYLESLVVISLLNSCALFSPETNSLVMMKNSYYCL